MAKTALQRFCGEWDCISGTVSVLSIMCRAPQPGREEKVLLRFFHRRCGETLLRWAWPFWPVFLLFTHVLTGFRH